MIKPIRKAVFPVAGLGTRFLPATKIIPKEMLTLVDRPLIQHVVDEALEAGIEEFIFVTSRGKTALEDHFDCSPELEATLTKRNKQKQLDLIKETEIPSGKLMCVRQQQPLGLGHAVLCAKELVGDEPFAVILPDMVMLSQTPCLKQLVDAYNKTGGNYIATEAVPREHTDRYGILDIENENGQVSKIKGLVEKPNPEEAPSNLCIIGRYILQPEIFNELSSQQAGAGGEIQLTDSMARMLDYQDYYGYNIEGKTYDCGDKVGFIEANVAFGLADPESGDVIREALKKFF